MEPRRKFRIGIRADFMRLIPGPDAMMACNEVIENLVPCDPCKTPCSIGSSPTLDEGIWRYFHGDFPMDCEAGRVAENALAKLAYGIGEQHG